MTMIQVPKKVCVVIPVYKGYDELGVNEQASIRRTLGILKGPQFCFIGPESLDFGPYTRLAVELQAPSSKKVFRDFYFKSISGYSKLLLSPGFYRSFLDYEFILVCQDDVWIFRDELDQWCSRGYDYIGAPWFEGWGKPHPAPYIIGVGNGGFSLRRVRSHLRVLHRLSYISRPGEVWAKLKEQPGTILYKLIRFVGQFTFRNNTFFLFNTWSSNEDGFWGMAARRNFKWFKVASDEDALAFCAEVYPRLSYDLNKKRLPFAVHAWERYDPDFWEEFISIT